MWARLSWTLGCLAFLIHVACAFGFYHHWSHADAYSKTAQRTAELVGLSWGGGLYANYAFALVWVADAAWWWRGLTRYEARTRGIELAVQGFLGFIILNATLVFGVGPIRWFGLGGGLLLTALFAYAHWRRKSALRAAATS
jgi:hypothetical protein